MSFDGGSAQARKRAASAATTPIATQAAPNPTHGTPIPTEVARNPTHATSILTDVAPQEGGTAGLVVRDPRVMRALAHPRRMELLRRLRAEGPATATVLGEATGQSAASASYHLRQLALHGLVEEVEGRGVGRERWWRARHRGTRIDAEPFLHEETRTAATAMAAAAVGDATGVVLGFLDAVERGAVGAEWVDAARLDDTTVHVTKEELADIGLRLAEMIEPYRREDRAARPAGARTCQVSIWTVPVVER
jgi:DNA-binding transcriptional ArsR family regulator